LQPGRFPVLDAGALPLLAADAGSGSSAIDEWYRSYADKELKDVKFCLAFVHEPGTLHSKKKIVSPADMKGLKVRPAHTTVANFVSLLGGTNVQSSAAEMRQLLERGDIDAVALSWDSAVRFKIERATKFHPDIPLYTTPFALVMSRRTYQSLSESQQKVVDDHCSTDWARKIALRWREGEPAGTLAFAKGPGREVYQLTSAQIGQWRSAADPLVQRWTVPVKKAGWNPAEVLNQLKAALAREGSAVR
jgi:TRAP-type C4-dicarboxylate transport system substrate-binding protein